MPKTHRSLSFARRLACRLEQVEGRFAAFGQHIHGAWLADPGRAAPAHLIIYRDLRFGGHSGAFDFTTP